MSDREKRGHDEIRRSPAYRMIYTAITAPPTLKDENLWGICLAYGKGVDYGSTGRELPNPYQENSNESRAYEYGLQHGRKEASTSAPPTVPWVVSRWPSKLRRQAREHTETAERYQTLYPDFARVHKASAACKTVLADELDRALAQHSEPGRVPERKDDSDAPPYFDIAESLAWASGRNACRNEIDALSASPAVPKAEELARCFHETYECLAPQYGYETRKETREFDSDSKNGRLMIEVCRVIRERFAAPAPDADERE